MAEKILWRFKGEVRVSEGMEKIAVTFLSGVPARDLMESDWAGMDEGKRDAVVMSGLYEKVETLAK